jgi:hypothetical protein
MSTGARALLLATLQLAMLTALGGCRLWYQNHEIRYRLTLEVATPAGIRTGSSVIEVVATETPDWAPGLPVTRSMDGEAVAVDLPNGRTLFALLNRPGHPDEPMHRPYSAFGSLIEGPEFLINGLAPDRAKQFAYLKREKPVTLVEGDQRPFLAMFADMRDPASIEEVDPDRLSASFGPGYSLLSVKIAITDDNVTTGLKTKLPWVGEDTGKRLRKPIDPYDHSVAATLYHGAFVRGH